MSSARKWQRGRVVEETLVGQGLTEGLNKQAGRGQREDVPGGKDYNIW
jgi:hypothetical protein